MADGRLSADGRFGFCYRCRADNHSACVGVPCECPCDEGRPAQSHGQLDDERRLSMGLRLDRVRGGHVEVSVFVGHNPGARGRAGVIVLRTEEWEEIAGATFRAGGRVPIDIVPAHPRVAQEGGGS